MPHPYVATRMRSTANTSDRFDVSSFQYKSSPHARGLLGRCQYSRVASGLHFGPVTTLARKTIPKSYSRVGAQRRTQRYRLSTPGQHQSLCQYLKAATILQETAFNEGWTPMQALQPLQALARTIAAMDIVPSDGGSMLDLNSGFRCVGLAVIPRDIELGCLRSAYLQIQRHLELGDRSINVELRQVWKELRDLEYTLFLFGFYKFTGERLRFLATKSDARKFIDHIVNCVLPLLELRRVRIIGLAMSSVQTGFCRSF